MPNAQNHAPGATPDHSDAMEFDPYLLPPDAIREPPKSLWEALKQIGPGIILAGTIVGSGELLLTTALGAKQGFVFLWLILYSCVIKVFVQIELGRYAISSGKPTLGAINELSGPRLGNHWIAWCWLFMMLSTVFQLGAMTGTVGQALHLAITGVPSEPPAQVAAATDAPTSDADSKANSDEQKSADNKTIAKTEDAGKGSSTTKDAASIPPSQRPEVPWAVLVCIAAIVLLWSGTYRRIEVVTTFLVVSVTLLTVAATCALPFTSFPIPWQEVMNGLKFQLPAEGIAVAFGVFGITGVGATELFFYPYWCLEKGYARYAGPADSSPEWEARAKGWIRVMHLDAWVSMVVFTISTLAFYFMGAAVLHPQGLHPEGQKMILTLSRMFVDSFGSWTQIVFLIGAAAVLFKTLYLSSAGNARLLADFISLAGVVKYQNPEHRGRMIHWLSISIPVLALVLFLAFKEPKWMVVVGGFGQALMLPIISFATIYFRYRKMDRRMEPRRITDILMWIAAISITLVAGYALKTQVEKLVSPPVEVQDAIKPPNPEAKPPGQ